MFFESKKKHTHTTEDRKDKKGNTGMLTGCWNLRLIRLLACWTLIYCSILPWPRFIHTTYLCLLYDNILFLSFLIFNDSLIRGLCTQSTQCTSYLFICFWLRWATCRILVSLTRDRTRACSLQWKCGVLTTGLLGKSPSAPLRVTQPRIIFELYHL